MERLYRVILLGFFVLGFVGAVASADRTSPDSLENSVILILKDVQEAYRALEERETAGKVLLRP